MNNNSAATAADRDEEEMPVTEPAAQAAAAAAAEARAAATSARERVRHNQKRHRDRRRDHAHRTPHTATDQPSDPTPAEVGPDLRTEHAHHIGPGPIASETGSTCSRVDGSLTRSRLARTNRSAEPIAPAVRQAGPPRRLKWVPKRDRRRVYRSG